MATADWLTKEERAYRRGALQAVEFLLGDVAGLPPGQIPARLAEWKQALVRARESGDLRYLGHYMDEVRADVTEGDAD